MIDADKCQGFSVTCDNCRWTFPDSPRCCLCEDRDMWESNLNITRDNINPSHYKDTYPFEVIDIIEKTLTDKQFEGYCLGNELKYRLRAGFKGDAKEDIEKALWYNRRRKDTHED